MIPMSVNVIIIIIYLNVYILILSLLNDDFDVC
jgi:hypothetical protein